ncbi:hypothetical protein SAMN02745216_02511 [Desulfatibacillum alkenivorans DSM 16219]|jgi:hypothetical protein|uniref:Uncharacterized protein n=1 Tax=Desulfatibacillum alkenivorans DSM 16219 TaxID=1121393 RepID=A0A1M6N4G6_9BACT|nr:hypothetical protein [Desulfatibacillum alkenivorans]SHJ90580.1 hypothetical protein SAMN02745216_02511 [Desulfatibacillum alkenivorans DSM 16219]
MVSDKKLIILFNEAKDFLETVAGRDVEELLAFTRYSKVTDMQEVYWRFARSLCNKRGMPATIGDVDDLEPFLFGFDPVRSAGNYGGDWRRLFTAIREGYTPPGPMDASREGSYWVQYVKGLLSGAVFLSRFETFKKFEKFVAGFAHHPIALAGLPLTLDRQVFAMGFPLATDWLRECGYTNYAKPDVHVMTIFVECGIVREWDTFQSFKILARMGRLVGEPPAVVDKVLWYIGSGRFLPGDEPVTRYREAFIEYVKPILEKD